MQFLRRLLEVEQIIHKIGPPEIRNVSLITIEELEMIRQIWLDDFHEFEDELPGIYESVTGCPYTDNHISKNKYFGAKEAELLKIVCVDLYSKEKLLPELARSLLDIEAKTVAVSNKRNVVLNFEQAIRRSFYQDEEEATRIAQTREEKRTAIASEEKKEKIE